MTYLIASDISIDFSLYHTETRSLKKSLLNKVSSRFGSDRKNRLVVQALKGISFSLESGDRLGLVGANGSGKTTLLRTLSGIYQPTHGSLSMEGTVISLLDPGQGMNTDLTGRENIWLRGYYLGLSKAQIVNLEKDIEEFTEIGHFIDIPVRNYSSGMIIRLAFGMATSFPSEILLMDEWILAGDANFMDKAKKRVESMVAGADILVLASHSPSILLEWTNRLIWLDNGEIKADGAPMEVFEVYLPKEDFEALANRRLT
jgi:lipopolysaccharide transport system ATP-binding protein